MFFNVFLAIYLLFLLTYIGLVGFAFYRVHVFSQNKELAGYSKKISLAIISVIIAIMAFTVVLFGMSGRGSASGIEDGTVQDVAQEEVVKEEVKADIGKDKIEEKESAEKKEGKKKDSMPWLKRFLDGIGVWPLLEGMQKYTLDDTSNIN